MWLALRFPHWALDSRSSAALETPGDDALLVVDNRGSRRIVIAASRRALDGGARTGMVLADARIVLPQARVYERNIAGEQAALERLAGWAWRYSSQVHIARADDAIECTRLVLEIGASLRLFGGRRALLAAIRDDLARLGYRFNAGVGASPQAALAFACAARQRQGQDHGSKLESLPLECLGLSPRTAASLTASGLRCSGELLALPPAALARRYGMELLEYLERLRGRRPHGLTLHRLPEHYRTRHELTGAVETTQGLVFVLRRALTDLAAFLRGADAAIQTLRLTLVHDDVPDTRVTLRLAAPSHAAAHLERVMNARLERLTLAAPVLEIRLASDRLRRIEQAQDALWQDAPSGGNDSWPAVLDRLRARLGHEAVGWLHAPADHRPEHASAVRDHPPDKIETRQAPRPLWLLDTPQPVTASSLAFITGAERIETGWWQANMRRDYFRARDRYGRLLWVYRDLGCRNNDEPPRYYLHGLFG